MRKVLDDHLGMIALSGGIAFLFGAAAVLVGLHFAETMVVKVFLFAIVISLYVTESLAVFFWLHRKSQEGGWQGSVAEWIKLAAGCSIFFPALFVLCCFSVFLLEPLRKKGWYP